MRAGSDHGGGGGGQAAASEPAVGQLDVIQTPLLTVGYDLDLIEMARGERHRSVRRAPGGRT